MTTDTVYVATKGYTASATPQFIIKVTDPETNHHVYYLSHGIWTYDLQKAVNAGNDAQITGCELMAAEFDGAKVQAAAAENPPVLEAVFRVNPPDTNPGGTHTDDGG